MGNPYTSVGISMYNATPPTDDGANTEANEVKWQTHLDKIGDPVKNALESVNTNTLSAFAKIFGNNVATATTTSTLDSTIQGKYISASNTITLTLPGAGAVGVPFTVAISNDGAGVVTLDGSASETINGAATLTLAAGAWAILVTDGSNWKALQSAASGTSLPRSYLAGLGMERNSGDTSNLDIAVGECVDSTNGVTITLDSALTKEINASWVAGNNNGGLSSTLTLASDTWYHVFAIIVGGSADIGFDTSSTAANLVADHTATSYRRIGSVRTDSGSIITAFKQYGDDFMWLDPALDLSISASTTASTETLTGAPPVAGLIAKCNVLSFKSGTGPLIYISSLDVDDEAPAESAGPLASNGGGSGGDRMYGYVEVAVDSSSQIRVRASTGTTTAKVSVVGYRDTRGRDL